MRTGAFLIVPLLLSAVPTPVAQEATVPVTVVGQVVDAACYMMHPPAASSATHDECGRACALKGVPLGVIDEKSKELYLADSASSKALLPHLHGRVRVKGQSVKRSEPLQLTMPVSGTHTMSVRVEGGYNSLRIKRVEDMSSTERKGK
jgi:hypothetical protein